MHAILEYMHMYSKIAYVFMLIMVSNFGRKFVQFTYFTGALVLLTFEDDFFQI